MSRVARGALCACILGLLGSLSAQEDPKLLGTWIGSSADNRGEKIVVEKGFVTIANDRVPYRFKKAGVILIGEKDDEEEIRYEIKGDDLILDTPDGRTTYRREGARPGDRPKTPPVGGGGETRPSDGPERAPEHGDPFARRFEGDGVQLKLEGSAADGYRGKMQFRGAEYPVEARADGAKLAGKFDAQGNSFQFTATLASDTLTLETGGKTYRLEGEKRQPPAAKNPMGGEDAPATKNPVGGTLGPAPSKAPPKLEGVYTGATTRFEHPRGWFSCELPEGWSVASGGDDGILINPGLKQTDTLDALVGLTWGRLEAADQNQPVESVVTKHVPRFRELLGQQGIQVGEPEGKVAAVGTKDVPGGVVTFVGKTTQGQDVRVWTGAIVKRDYWLAVLAITLAGKEEAYLPKAKRVFASLEPKPPERNAKLEAALVGRTFTTSSYGKITGSAFHASYAFAAGGSVTRRLMSNVPAKPGLPGASTDAERTGRYEVCGDIVYLFFETGQEVGQVLQEGGGVAGMRIGEAQYR